jgi:selenoprotein W-related protein
LLQSSRGAFEVIVNGNLVYSKLQTGEFPDFDAIIQTVKSMA